MSTTSALTAPSRPRSTVSTGATTSTSEGAPLTPPPVTPVPVPADADTLSPRRPGPPARAWLPDDQLVRLGASGDGVALDELFRRHRRSARTVARRQLRNEADAEDAVAEAFTRAFERLTTLRSPDRFRAFLLAIVRSVASDRRRAATRARPEAELDLRPAAGDVEAAVLSGEASRSLVAAVERLPARQRYAVRRFYWDDVPVAVLAAELRLSVNATTQLLFRARAGLALQTPVSCRRAGRARRAQ